MNNAKAYDDAFATFFARLAADGITPANTLFIVNSEENDHFAGGTPNRSAASAPTPAGCDGVTVACSYAAGQIGDQALRDEHIILVELRHDGMLSISTRRHRARA